MELMETSRQSEISQLDMAAAVEQDVVRLDVAKIVKQ
jgi:hypothetical protein